MVHRTTLPAALVAALAFGTVPALAAATAQATTPDVAGFQHAKIALDQAIAAAEKESGGKAASANFEMMNGKDGYLVSVLAHGKMHELWVDPQSGKATPETKLSKTEENQEALDKADLDQMHGAKTTLQQAISMAEQHSNGKAIDAGIEWRNNKLTYNVRVVREGKLSSVWVDPVSGQVMTPGAHASLQRQREMGG
jgi:uncharacterized membrane protein YkoI